MSNLEGVSVPCNRTAHPNLHITPAVTWDDTWQIPVRQDGQWMLMHSTSQGFWQVRLNGRVYTWPRAIAVRICGDLAMLGAYSGTEHDLANHDNNHTSRCVCEVFARYIQWCDKSDADYEASGNRP